MRSVSALDVRRRFGEIVDAAANGDRIVIERAGQPVAAIVPLSDLALVDPERRKAIRLAAIDEIVRLARRRPPQPHVDATAIIRADRDGRAEHILRNVAGVRGPAASSNASSDASSGADRPESP
jgi:prevent-host-death family protein